MIPAGSVKPLRFGPASTPETWSKLLILDSVPTGAVRTKNEHSSGYAERMAARGMTALLIAFLALAGYTPAFGAARHALLHKRDSQAGAGLGGLYCAGALCRHGGLPARGGQPGGQSRRPVAVQRGGSPGAGRYAFGSTFAAARTPLIPPGEAAPPEQTVARVGRALTGRDPLGGNELVLLRNGEEAYPAMLAAINEAASHVYLSTYMFKGGLIGQSLCRRVGTGRRARRRRTSSGGWAGRFALFVGQTLAAVG